MHGTAVLRRRALDLDDIGAAVPAALLSGDPGLFLVRPELGLPAALLPGLAGCRASDGLGRLLRVVVRRQVELGLVLLAPERQSRRVTEGVVRERRTAVAWTIDTVIGCNSTMRHSRCEGK